MNCVKLTLSQCLCPASDVKHLIGNTLLPALLYPLRKASANSVALSVAFFIATIRAACSLANDSRIA
jgi:hypothetical protein